MPPSAMPAAPHHPIPPDDDDVAAAPSKTARKKQMHALQALGERIVALPPEQAATLALPERLLEAVELARTIRAHEGLRRQMQYIGRLMRDVDAAAIEATLEAMQHGHRAQVARHHAAERWRDRLLHDEGALTALVAEHRAADAQRMRQLRRQALRQPDDPRPRRELYRAVLEALAPAPSAADPAPARSDREPDSAVSAADLSPAPVPDRTPAPPGPEPASARPEPPPVPTPPDANP